MSEVYNRPRDKEAGYIQRSLSTPAPTGESFGILTENHGRYPCELISPYRACSLTFVRCSVEREGQMWPSLSVYGLVLVFTTLLVYLGSSFLHKFRTTSYPRPDHSRDREASTTPTLAATS